METPTSIESQNSLTKIFTGAGQANLQESKRDFLRESRILILERSNLLKPFKKELNAAGFCSVVSTASLEVAKESIENSELDLILVLEDCLDKNQFGELCQWCQNKKIYVVVVTTTTTTSESRNHLFELGVTDFLSFPAEGIEVVSRVRNSLHSLQSAKKLEEFSAQMQSDILIDPLTKIANRRAFDFELSRKMIEWERQRTPLALLMIDIDYFKRVNDQFGHLAGDFILTSVASIINSCVRDMDLVCRYGGEEFAAILPIKRPNESTQTAERIREKIEESVIEFEDLSHNITISIGVAEAMKGDDQELIVKRADTALYDSKRNGRNRVTFHDGAQCLPVNKSSVIKASQESKSPTKMAGWAIHNDDFNLCSSHVLIVDDSWETTQVTKAYLQKAGFRNLLCESDSTRVLGHLSDHTPDLLVLDLIMPDIDGLTLLKEIRSNSDWNAMPVIILTSHTDRDVKSQALELGASDFLNKPVLPNELITRVKNTLLANSHAKFLGNYSTRLEQEVKIRTAELVASRREAIQCLARAAEAKYDSTGHHIVRIGKYAAIIAAQLGFTDTQIVELEHAAQLHDVGKLSLPEAILEKTEKLTDDEFSIVKDHCSHGGNIIRDELVADEEHREQCASLLDSCSTPVMRMAALVAESHHEKWDGSGYPKGLKGQNIPIEARIVAVCDVFDAISSPKTYRAAFDLKECFEIIQNGSGTHFDPEIVEAFFACRDEILSVYRDFKIEQQDAVVANA